MRASAMCRGVDVSASANLQAAIDRHGPGTTFCIGRGTHRLSTYVIPKSRDRFVGRPGAVLNGSVLVTSFARSGSLWVAAVPRTDTVSSGECTLQSPDCGDPNDVFLDGKPLHHAAALAGLTASAFYLDHAAGRLYLAVNPGGHRVEMAFASMAFKGWRTSVDGVTIRGLRIEKFANQAGLGAVNGRPSWSLIGNTVRLNHGIGVQDASVIRDNRIIENGQLGVGVSFGSHVLIEGNTIRGNNYAGFDPGWEAGGVKFVRSDHVTLRRNTVVDNHGPGLWADGGDIYVTYEKNLIVGNAGPGIQHEISYNALITRNVIRRNGLGTTSGWMDGAGILLYASGNVKVVRNIVSKNRDGIGIEQTDRGSGAHGLYEAHNDLVLGNTITMTRGYTGLVENTGDTSYYTTRHNVFTHNTYYLGCGRQFFAWADPSDRARSEYLTPGQWRAAGNDRPGRFHSIC